MNPKQMMLAAALTGCGIATLSGAAFAQKNTTGLIDFNNQDGSAVEVLGPYAGNSNASGNGLTVTQEAVANGGTVASNVTYNPLYFFSATAEKTIDIVFLVTPASGAYNGNYGCQFELVYTYQGTVNGVTQYYYPNTYATPVYPSGATTVPTCYAQASGPQYAFNSPNGAYFSEFFQIKGLP